mmetsp:Transcript_33658/g.51950  ORF Transcript_33658/g.51950 Transcript_33658/m.51950 type:complete len:87 (+) Transcript_33658:1369-1629(+)
MRLIRKHTSKPREFQIEARDIILSNYLMKDQIEAKTKYLNTVTPESKNTDFVDAYLSTPQFINYLTELSDNVMTFKTPEEKRAFVR